MHQGVQPIPVEGGSVPAGPWKSQQGTSIPLEKPTVSGKTSRKKLQKERPVPTLTNKGIESLVEVRQAGTRNPFCQLHLDTPLL